MSTWGFQFFFFPFLEFHFRDRATLLEKRKNKQREIDIQFILFQLFQTFASSPGFMICSDNTKKIFTQQDELKHFGTLAICHS